MKLAAIERKHKLLIGVSVIGILLVTLTGYRTFPTIVAMAAAYAVLRIGFGVLGSFAQPIPEPPPAGELRKVKINFRCTLCGTEVRMTVANDEMPTPPRHCQEDMEFVAPVME